MRAANGSLYIALAALVSVLAFLLYALSGGDLCVWCQALGR